MPTTSEISERDRELAALKQHHAWPELRAVAEEKMGQEFKLISKTLMRGERVRHSDVQYRRGFFAGIKFLLDCPEFSEKRLERALKDEESET